MANTRSDHVTEPLRTMDASLLNWSARQYGIEPRRSCLIKDSDYVYLSESAVRSMSRLQRNMVLVWRRRNAVAAVAAVVGPSRLSHTVQSTSDGIQMH